MARFIDLLVREKYLAPLPPTCPVIIGDEQLAYIDGLPDDHPLWRGEDFPNMAPPFPSFWIEARSRVADVHYGVEVILAKPTMDQAEKYFRFFWPWHKLKAPIAWMFQIFCYMRHGRAFGVMPQVLYLFVDQHGIILNPNHPTKGNLLQGLSEPLPELMGKRFIQLSPDDGLNIVPFALRTWAMLNCVNVGIEAVAPPPALSKSHKKKYGIPMSTWYELRLKTKKYAQAEAIQDRDESGDRRQYREHLCRGHFKRRKTGVFWWNAHVRGSHDLGTIRKSYSIAQ